MNCIATFDIGTTAIKGVLVDFENGIIRSESKTIDTYFVDGEIEQDPNQWYRNFCEISSKLVESDPHCNIVAIIMSGQMQDVIPIRSNGDPAMNAILYSDGRAGQEAERINSELGEESIRSAIGNRIDGSAPFAKLLWLNKYLPSVLSDIEKVVFSSKDFIIRELTGESITDFTTGATTGLMNIRTKKWQTDWLKGFGIPERILPKINDPIELVGVVTEPAAAETGFNVGTRVFSGTGDAGSTTLAGAVLKAGDFNINVGTTGWIATASDKPFENASVFNLAAIIPQSYINVVPFLNAGNVHQWIGKIFSANEGEIDYAEIHRLLSDVTVEYDDPLFLPYLVGERFPVMDQAIRGVFTGISASTSKGHLARAALEGVAFSILQGLKTIDQLINRVTVVGGGTRESCWMQILANVLNQELVVFLDAELLPAVALATVAKIGLGIENDYAKLSNYLLNSVESVRYSPQENLISTYENRFQQFLKLYPLAKAIT